MWKKRLSVNPEHLKLKSPNQDIKFEDVPGTLRPLDFCRWIHMPISPKMDPPCSRPQPDTETLAAKKSPTLTMTSLSRREEFVLFYEITIEKLLFLSCTHHVLSKIFKMLVFLGLTC